MSEIQNKKIKNFIYNSSAAFFKYSVLFLCLMILVRVFFFFETYFRLDIDWSLLPVTLSGFLYDVVVLCKIAALLFLPFMIVSRFSKKAAVALYLTVIFLYLILYMMLTEYFCNMDGPLDSVLFAYSSEEIKLIIESSTSVSFVQVFLPLLLITISIMMIVFCRRIKFKKLNGLVSMSFLVVFILVAIFVDNKTFVLQKKVYSDKLKNNYSTNQIAYTYYRINEYFMEKEREKTFSVSGELEKLIGDFHVLYPENTYLNERYPLVRTIDTCDVLGPFFDVENNRNLPNIVFVIVEGLGQKLTGVDDPSISFTPFIDSLKSVGLYWNNCVSAAQRTFGALPSIFASAPYGERGFALQWTTTPNHNSLINDLTNNGYTASFFYGGSSSFDGQDVFMESNGVSYILNQKPEDEYSDAELLKESRRWGFDDKDMFAQAMNYKKEHKRTPFLDVYLTLTTHEPFFFSGVENYIEKVKEMTTSHTFPTMKEKNTIENNKNIFATLLYADESLRFMMNEYKRLGQFDNTIFIVMGDHRMGPLTRYWLNPIERYHIPLIIYSPLLKRNKIMHGVISHLDVTPTINAFLSRNYNYVIDSKCHWLGMPFDTSANFNCKQTMAFMMNNRTIPDMLQGDYFITEDDIYKVKDDLAVEKIEDEKKLHQMKRDLETLKGMHRYVVNTNNLWEIDRTGMEKIFASRLDFDRISDDVCKPIEEIDENKCLHLYPENENLNLCSTFVIHENVVKLITEVSFDYKCVSNSNSPKLIVSLVKDKNIYVRQIDVPIEKNTSFKNYTYYGQNVIKEDIKGAKMKIYLWNPDKADLLIDDINVTISKK